MFRVVKLRVQNAKLKRPFIIMRSMSRLFNAGLNVARGTSAPGGSAAIPSATAQVAGTRVQQPHYQYKKITKQPQQQQQQQQKSFEDPLEKGEEQDGNWPRKIFSGIQPTGSLHLGNYLGAVRKWTQLQNAKDDVTICIVDMHSITLPHNPPELRENIFEMAATLLACGIDPGRATLFVQSAVLEHCEFNWILSSLTTMPRLAQLPQFKEKSRTVRDVPLGLYVYPVLQAADIMLYKATHVPVGADQVQHIQLAQHLARSFNSRYGISFPVCHALVEQGEASRVLSLRDPAKKMSKSDGQPKATINISDAPEVIAEKIKKAVTDFTSDITYNPHTRPGVSNLVNIHAQVTNQSIASIVEESKQLDTAKYKERVADAVIAHLSPIREQIQKHLNRRNELIYLLEIGAEKARQTAQQTMSEVKQRLGLGTNLNLPPAVVMAPPLPEKSKKTASQKGAAVEGVAAVGFAGSGGSIAAADQPTAELGGAGEDIVKVPSPTIRRVVPFQTMRVEKVRQRGPPKHVFVMDTRNAPKIGFRPPPTMTGGVSSAPRNQRLNNPPIPTPPSMAANSTGFLFHNPAHINNQSALASVTNAVNAAYQQEEYASGLSNSSFYKAAVAAYKASSNTHVQPGKNEVSSISQHATSDEVENQEEQQEYEESEGQQGQEQDVNKAEQ